MSKIATETANTLLAVFAGQTVDQDTVLAEITAQYAYAQKRTGVSSYFQVTDALERAGVATLYTGPDYTGQKYFTFPRGRSMITTQHIVDTINAAGLDHHDFRCQTAAQLANDLHTTNLWACIAEFPRTRNHATQDQAWALAGQSNPYAEGTAA